jgi:cyclase
LVTAIDAGLEKEGKWWVDVNGGRIKTDKELFSWALEAQERGTGEILFTSMNHDGTKNGFACDALATLSENLSIPVIASGGAGNVSHFSDVFTNGKADAALAASIFHFNEIPIPVLKDYLRKSNIVVR